MQELICQGFAFLWKRPPICASGTYDNRQTSLGTKGRLPGKEIEPEAVTELFGKASH
jgi:hypothetical protein